MGSAFSKMSAGPRAQQATPNEIPFEEPREQQPSSGMLAIQPPSDPSPRPTIIIPQKPDLAALRAAALKSAREKKNAAPKQGNAPVLPKTVAPTFPDKEDGEISEEDEPGAIPSQSIPPPPTTQPPSPPPPPPPFSPPDVHPPTATAPSIVRSTVVTISDKDKGTVTRALPVPNTSGDEEGQWVEIVRNLLHEGITPETLIRKGVPARYVARVCEEIVEGSKRRATLWSQFREPPCDDSATPSIMDSGAPSRTRSPQSRSSSPDIKVAVAMGRSGSESSTDALMERMSPPASMAPRIVSSWVPGSGDDPSLSHIPPVPPSLPNRPTPANAIHVDSYRPLSRPSSTAPPPSEVAGKPQAKGKAARRRKRDRDGAQLREAQPVTTLNYDDEDDAPSTSTSSAQTPTTTGPAAVPTSSMAPLSTSALPPSAEPAPLSAISHIDLAETRRRALESMRKRKNGTPASIAPTPPPPEAQAGPSKAILDEAAQLEREILSGSTVEVPMDIDEMEDGEIADEPVVTHLPLPATVARPSIRKGVKRPHAEDMMDNNARPVTAQRPHPPPKRRAFGTALRPNRLVIVLDDDSDSESEDEPTPPPIATPIIAIPTTADLIAEKEANIRRLREQIAARLAARSCAPTPSGASTPTIAAGVKAAARAADQVGVDGVAPDVVEAAVLAAAHDHRSRQKAAVDDDVPMEDVDDIPVSNSGASSPAKSMCSDTSSSVTPSSNFQPYAPLLSRYPQLNNSVGPAFGHLTTDSHSLEEEDGSDDFTIDWPLVSSIILTHQTQSDSSSFWCRSEAGGGRCADPKCSDFHLGRFEPTDDELVVYVQDILALQADNNKRQQDKDDDEDEDAEFNENQISAALTAARGEREQRSKGKGKGKAKGKKGKRNSRNSNQTRQTPEDLVDLLAATTRKLQTVR